MIDKGGRNTEKRWVKLKVDCPACEQSHIIPISVKGEIKGQELEKSKANNKYAPEKHEIVLICPQTEKQIIVQVPLSLFKVHADFVL